MLPFVKKCLRVLSAYMRRIVVGVLIISIAGWLATHKSVFSAIAKAVSHPVLLPIWGVAAIFLLGVLIPVGVFMWRGRRKRETLFAFDGVYWELRQQWIVGIGHMGSKWIPLCPRCKLELRSRPKVLLWVCDRCGRKRRWSFSSFDKVQARVAREYDRRRRLRFPKNVLAALSEKRKLRRGLRETANREQKASSSD